VPKLKASAQYNDWVGSVAADVADARSIYSLLIDRALKDESEHPVAISFYVGEAHEPYVSVFLLKSASADHAKEQLSSGSTPKLRKVDLKLSLNEFFTYFKRFDVVLTQRGLDLVDREYDEELPH
jgi:hypothetical protein